MIPIYEVNRLLTNGKIKKIILDTDTYNEVDDQFALAYAMRAKDKVELLSINAAPFLNNRSVSAEDGMEKSYHEIYNIMKLTDSSANIPVYKGSRRFLTNKTTPENSPAAQNIVDTVMRSEEPIFVVAIGAPTNIASAILMEPRLVDKMIFVWLGGHALHWKNSQEFNMMQDLYASQILFDSGVAMVQIPCAGVCTELATTLPELEACIGGKNALCDYLVDIVRHYTNDTFAWSKVIWDVSAVAALTLPEASDRVILPTAHITCDCCYAPDASRPPMIYTRWLNRNAIFRDLFLRLAAQ